MKRIVLIILFSFITLVSCHKDNDDSIEIVELHWEKHNLDEVWDIIEDCDGIVLTGGIDVHPKFYDNERLEFPNGDGVFNEERDEFEMHVFETALNLNPVKPTLPHSFPCSTISDSGLNYSVRTG